jgi:hypothetical protein
VGEDHPVVEGEDGKGELSGFGHLLRVSFTWRKPLQHRSVDPYSGSESALLRFAQQAGQTRIRPAFPIPSKQDGQVKAQEGSAMTSQARQSELYARLQEVLGPQPAETLMTLFTTRADLATKADLTELRGELSGEMASLRGELRSEMAYLRGELRNEMAGLREDMRQLRSELSSFVRTFVVAQLTAMVGLTGIFVAVTRLL